MWIGVELEKSSVLNGFKNPKFLKEYSDFIAERICNLEKVNFLVLYYQVFFYL